ncbi:IS1182 family transposase, partial [Grimontia hollisae]|uniref:IS1182 family transposase n=1 Tax=Grimontia hollisae TaxID=673 RepID=UPI0023DAC46F
DTDVFERIFIRIVEQAMSKGMVDGRTLFTDSTHLKANANKRKYTNELAKQNANAYAKILDEAIEADRAAEGKRPLKPKETHSERNTKVSTTDPESGFMTRDQKPQGFFYLDHRTVDGKHGIILDTHVTPGNVNDAQPYIARLDVTLDRFNLSPIAAGLDAGYFTATICHELEQRQMLPVMGYRRPHRTKNAIKKKHFSYDKETDRYLCPQGQELVYKTTNRQAYREYHSNPQTCKTCPLRDDCTKSKNHKRVITRHLFEKSVENANALRLTAWGKKVYRRRAETVERSFADAKQHHGHRYARFRGLLKVQIQCFLAAAAQNIKKIALME